MRFVGPDDALELHEIDRNGDTRVYARLESHEPTLEELAALVGSYDCPEIGATYRVSLKDGGLAVGERKNGPRTLRPLAPDFFAVDGYGNNSGRNARWLRPGRRSAALQRAHSLSLRPALGAMPGGSGWRSGPSAG
ncbi:MAG: hypothetical protein M9890_07855 [Thermomicrobiales bacterium]|nr:hypothetical protein [Thermomicrobiales bacterium]